MHSPSALAIRAAARRLSAADHPGTIRAYYPYWDVQYRPMLIQAVEFLPPDKFDFKPRPAMLTAHQLILHIAEAERGWMHNIAQGGTYEEWVVPHEDPTHGLVTVYDAPDRAALLHELEKWHRLTQHWFDQPASELARVITYQPAGEAEREYTLHWILDHLQEHELHHRAQLNLYFRLIEMEPPSI